MTDFLKTLGDFSTAAAAIIPILTLLALLGKGAMYVISIPERVRRRLYKPRFIVLPTPEEIAKYCVKSDNALFLTDAEWIEELKGWDTRRYDAWVRQSQDRIATLYYGTYVGMALVIGRMLTVNWSETDPQNNALTLILGTWLGAFWLLGLQLLNPPRRQVTHVPRAWPRIWQG
ncbi:hypothetical protein [Sinorhizobium fredii]|uniref:hypothetical protein n=1 Tax=Rhizobium fredii TaxID=380 RepID=UPI0004B09E68|nr:hypothetical protein [Sinorhizobium fredii]